MQTFVPYPDFAKSAAVLDMKRLGKQRVETLQILNALTGASKGWVNHPATRMWRGHTEALCAYGVAICDAWTAKGYQDTCKAKMMNLVAPSSLSMPSWWGDPVVHASHRSNLLRKDPEFYSQFGWDEPHDLPYEWRNP